VGPFSPRIRRPRPAARWRRCWPVWAPTTPAESCGRRSRRAQILNRSTFKERGFYTSFGVVNEDSVRHVAEYLNGPTSPLQGWDGWRYRSGIIYEPTSGQKPGPEAQRAAGAAAASSRSIVAVVFDPAGGKR
jgi:hypothetical protein